MFYLTKYPSKAKLVFVKKIFSLLAFIAGMAMYGQVVVDTVFTTAEEIHFVSDDGGGMYTVSGPGAGNDGFLAIYDEGSDSWEYKSFPAKTNVGSVHDAQVYMAYTVGGITISYGLVANSATHGWSAVRRYGAGNSSFSHEIPVYDSDVKLFAADPGIYARVFVGAGGDAWGLASGTYLVKINTQDLSLEWSYAFSGGYDIASNDVLISTAKVYRGAIQALPNGNIAVTVGNSNGYELWEFDPTTGQKIGVIDDSYTDYDRDGTEELQYQFHRWKVVDGVLFHEFWNDPNNSQDQNVGHWEKLEVPGWAPPGSGNVNTSWDPSQLQVTAVSDWETYDSFGMVFSDFSVESDGSLKSGGYKLSSKLEPTTGEDIFYGWSGSIRDSWVRPNGDLMAMGLHGLYRFSGQQYTAQPGLNPAGTGVVEAHENELYEGGTWVPVAGEGALVLSSLPSVGSQPDPSWWTIPAGYHDGGHTAIMESHRPGEEGQLFFRVAILADNNAYVEAYRRITLYDANQVSVPETEISGLSLYPNPVNSFLTVEADMSVDAVRVYNTSGIAVKEVSGDTRIFMGDLPAGVYVVEVTAGEAVSRRKIVKK